MSETRQRVPFSTFMVLVDGAVQREQLRRMALRGDLDAIQPTGQRGRWQVAVSEAERLLARRGNT